jgi:hypothetical protein
MRAIIQQKKIKMKWHIIFLESKIKECQSKPSKNNSAYFKKQLEVAKKQYEQI